MTTATPQLNKQQLKNAFRWRHQEGWTVKAIADRLQLPVGSLRALMRKPTKSDPPALATAKRLYGKAKTDRDQRCVIGNFGDVLGIKFEG